jgi:precorrin-8X/cobalt-precorrin-8 methylmutase
VDFITDPGLIEERSMAIIAPHLAGLNLTPAAAKIYSRIIHAAGDVDYANHIRIHPLAIEAASRALKAGCDIFCDVEMVRTGINKRRLGELGGSVHCLIADPAIAAAAKNAGITRAMAAMRAFGPRLHGAVVAIGNAPTALFELLKMIADTGIRPAAIIGVPVGFVGAAESKELLAATVPAPYITVAGTKGGSPIAAAAANAILYLQD